MGRSSQEHLKQKQNITLQVLRSGQLIEGTGGVNLRERSVTVIQCRSHEVESEVGFHGMLSAAFALGFKMVSEPVCLCPCCSVPAARGQQLEVAVPGGSLDVVGVPETAQISQGGQGAAEGPRGGVVKIKKKKLEKKVEKS